MGELTDCAKKLGRAGGLKTQRRYRAKKVGEKLAVIHRNKQRDTAQRNMRHAHARAAQAPHWRQVPAGTVVNNIQNRVKRK